MDINQVHIDSVKKAFEVKGYRWFPDGRINVFGIRSSKSVPRTFDDIIGCLWRNSNTTSLDLMLFKGTTVAGLYYLQNPINVEGTAILVEGQYKNSHVIDLHKGQYEALCQRGKMKFYRDNDKDKQFDFNPKTIVEEIIGCNVHRANPNYESTLVDKWSAACQVMANPEGFKDFMYLARESEQFNDGRFDYTLLNEKDFVV